MAKVYCNVLIATLVVFSTFYAADAITCNVTSQATTTTPGCASCSKTVVYAVNVALSTTRLCIPTGVACTPGSGATVAGINTGTFTYCCSNIDYCNHAASSVSINLGMAVMAALGALWVLRR